MSRLPGSTGAAGAAGSTSSSVVIGIAGSAGDRARLARLLGRSEAFLIVSNAAQARAFLGLVPAPASPQEPEQEPDWEPGPVDRTTELRLDADRRVVRWGDREVGLTRLEHDFLHCLVSERGRIWTYQRLHRAVWGNDHLGRGSDIHSVARRVRRKLSRLGTPTTIHSVRGIGLRLTEA